MTQAVTLAVTTTRRKKVSVSESRLSHGACAMQYVSGGPVQSRHRALAFFRVCLVFEVLRSLAHDPLFFRLHVNRRL